MSARTQDDVRQEVRSVYAEVARGGEGCCEPSCCAPAPTFSADAARKIGYSQEDLASVPEGANMGLGCGNPGAIAALQQGETVLDLGSGGGFDCFLAAKRVGSTGRVMGVDMTPDMISKARDNAAKLGANNVEFRLGEIEHLPVENDSVDVIMSNCVINLSPDKAQVLREAARVLKPGGRVAISDIVALRELPEELASQAAMVAGCVAGAITVAEYEMLLRDAGFENIRVNVKPESRAFIKDWFPGSGAEEFVTSANIEATTRA